MNTIRTMRMFGAKVVKVAKNQTLTEQLIEKEAKYGCNNYHPLPVVLKKGRGIYVTDVEDKKYMDFLSAYSAVNQGHCHPRISKVITAQSKILTLTSRAFHSDQLGKYEEFMTKTFGFDKMLPMNSGVEACESAVKFARRWAYDKKKVPINKAKIVMAKNNFWGRSIAACASSSDPLCSDRFGPYGNLGFVLIPYGDLTALENMLEKDPNIAAFMVEPIQGEAGVIIPPEGYLKNAKRLCRKHNVLLIFDEVQTGLGRTGKMSCHEWENAKPDIMTLGKALSGGFMPISAVLTSNSVMNNIKPGEHGSTFGGNPLACAIATEAINVIIEEGLVENSNNMGQIFRGELSSINSELIKDVRGKGLMNAIEVRHDLPVNAWDLCMSLKEKGLIAKPTHDNIIRFTPPLVINQNEIIRATKMIKEVIREAEIKCGLAVAEENKVRSKRRSPVKKNKTDGNTKKVATNNTNDNNTTEEQPNNTHNVIASEKENIEDASNEAEQSIKNEREDDKNEASNVTNEETRNDDEKKKKDEEN